MEGQGGWDGGEEGRGGRMTRGFVTKYSTHSVLPNKEGYCYSLEWSVLAVLVPHTYVGLSAMVLMWPCDCVCRDCGYSLLQDP